MKIKNNKNSSVLSQKKYRLLKVYIDENGDFFLNGFGNDGLTKEYFMRNIDSFHMNKNVLLEVMLNINNKLGEPLYFECDDESIVFLDKSIHGKNTFPVDCFLKKHEFFINYFMRHFKSNGYGSDQRVFKILEKISVCDLLNIITFLYHSNLISEERVRSFLSELYAYLDCKYAFSEFNNIFYLTRSILDNHYIDRLSILPNNLLLPPC